MYSGKTQVSGNTHFRLFTTLYIGTVLFVHCIKKFNLWMNTTLLREEMSPSKSKQEKTMQM